MFSCIVFGSDGTMVHPQDKLVETISIIFSSAEDTLYRTISIILSHTFLLLDVDVVLKRMKTKK